MGGKLKAQDVVLATLAAALWVTIFRPGPLDLPFFWDEADVYVPGARLLAENGFGLSTTEFTDDYSRGHPPLFYVMAAAAFAALGASPAAGHLLVLPFTVASLAGTYLLGVRISGRRVGVAAALALGSTPLFMSIGNMMLPEIPLTAAAVLGLLAIAHGRLGWAVAFGVFGVLVKETGLAAAGAVFFIVLVDGWERGGLTSRDTLRRAAVAALPGLVLAGFFVWQKLSVGYFVYPHHAALFAERSFAPFTIFPSLCFWHARWVLVGAAALATWLGWPAVRERVMAPPGETGRWAPSRRAVLAGLAALILVNAVFFAQMFWLERYALPAHPAFLLIAMFLVVVGLDHLPVLAALPAAVVIALGLGHLWAPTGPDQEEHTFAYAHVIATHERAFAAVQHDAPDVLTTWPMTVELENPYLGYVDERVEALSARYYDPGDERSFTHVLVSDASPQADTLRSLASEWNMAPLGTFRLGHAPALELYGR